MRKEQEVLSADDEIDDSSCYDSLFLILTGIPVNPRNCLSTVVDFENGALAEGIVVFSGNLSSFGCVFVKISVS